MGCRRDPASKGARLRAAARHGGAATPIDDPKATPLSPAATPALAPQHTPRDPAAAPRRIDDREKGSIRYPASVTVGLNGSVTGDIHAPEIIVEGEVRGNLYADERICLEAGARVIGDLNAPRVGILPGAQLKGRISMRRAEALLALDDSGAEELLMGEPGSVG